jgi:hypothetical protein
LLSQNAKCSSKVWAALLPGNVHAFSIVSAADYQSGWGGGMLRSESAIIVAT